MKLQSIRFDKRYWDRISSRLWLSQHKMIPIKNVHVAKKYYKYRLIQPSLFDNFITQKLPNGIDLIIGI